MKRWSAKQLLVIYGVHNIYLQEMESAAFTLIAFTHHGWCTQYILKRDVINNIYSLETVYTAFSCSPYTALRYVAHNIFSRQVKYMTFTHDKWSPLYIFLVYRLRSIYSCEKEYTTYTHKRWGKEHLLTRDGVHCIY